MSPDVKLPLEPLAYHRRLVGHLQSCEPELWKWFSAERQRGDEKDAVRLDLLKCTYRIERSANPALYAAADEVARKLGCALPLTFYQSQNSGALNVSLAYSPGEAHVVFQGPVTEKLSTVELQCVCAHELLHFLLLDGWREYSIAAQILSATSNDHAAGAAHIASARLFRLYTEIYCDRGAFVATADLHAAISALVKVETGVLDVSAESYLRQTEEVFSRGDLKAEGLTHPESFIRAKAMQLFAQQPQRADDEIMGVIEGSLTLAELDLLGQHAVCELTRRLIGAFLRPKWLHTEPVLGHARLFFDDFKPGTSDDPSLAAELKTKDQSLQDYYCYVLLDFAAADRELEDAPLAAALLFSEQLGLADRFRQLAAKELNLKKKQLAALETEASSIVAQASSLQ